MYLLWFEDFTAATLLLIARNKALGLAIHRFESKPRMKRKLASVQDCLLMLSIGVAYTKALFLWLHSIT
ncbi:hypothetical protein D0894_12330 [Pseudomonas monteilii]|uniref:Uncharacterized protein n=1 Tax=Pseudomonas monteilii TaxID=76759 RepID=A0A399M6J4_9PSED|nr:hypothetical protein D0894_12330 [Pseudomonas monteilii]